MNGGLAMTTTDAFVNADAPGAVAITFNGVPRCVSTGMTLAALIHRLGRTPASVATSVNGRFVPRGERESVVLQEGDEIACFEPIVGG